MSKSKIEWTDVTWNPVTGCTKISPGCKHCYAERFAERFRGIPGHPYEQGFDIKLHPERILQPRTWKTAKLVFVNSMSDLFHKDVPDEFIDKVFDSMGETTRHTYQVLTKRAERMDEYARARVARTGAPIPEHIWLGASVETQGYIGRAQIVAALPTKVRWLSVEPLIGPVDLSGLLGPDKVNWVVVGGESGPGARPMDAAWVLTLQAQCAAATVPFFFKQWGGVRKKETGCALAGHERKEYPGHVRN